MLDSKIDAESFPDAESSENDVFAPEIKEIVQRGKEQTKLKWKK